MSDIKATVNLDVSNAITSLKALQRELRKTTQEFKRHQSVSGGLVPNSGDGDAIEPIESAIAHIAEYPGVEVIDVRRGDKCNLTLGDGHENGDCAGWHVPSGSKVIIVSAG